MRSLALALGLILAMIGAACADNAILVFDASGSMWGKVENKTKIEIARQVVGNLLASIPQDRQLGLIAYGHRRDGDCNDIEELAPVGNDREAIRKAVNVLNPKGKTPLSAAVKMAAEKLHYTSEKSTVILVSDGMESCKADPCALGVALEATGVDLTVHVIGFGLESDTESAGLKCLAAATGGKYFSASNANELSRALAQTVATTTPPPAANIQSHVVLRATELEGGPEITSGLTWTVAAAGSTPAFTKSGAGVVETDLPPGTYEVSVERSADGLKRKTTLTAAAGGSRTVTIALPVTLQASLTVMPLGTAPAGSKVSVAWQGPNRQGDYITVVEKGADVGTYHDYQYTKSGSPVSITLPGEPGDYEVRYVLGQPQKVLASAPLKATGVSATLTAPDSAAVGASVQVTWLGPNYPGDFVTIVAPSAKPSSYKSYFRTSDGSPGRLQIPSDPGVYELRYVVQNDKVIARKPITVTAVEASLATPDSAPAGSSVNVDFQGPRNEGDFITVVKPGSGPDAYTDYFYTKDEGKHAITMPAEPGPHEIRYVLRNERVLVTRPITVTAVGAKLDGPARVAARASFQVTWQGPNYEGDYVTITQPGDPDNAYRSYANSNAGSPSTLTAPDQPGSYEIRYVLNGKKVLARKPLEVTAP
jgi:Ca-activated chloride channel family protein